jgi:hypothetical protein
MAMYGNISKIGHYDMGLGGLDSPTTNQRLYRFSYDDYDMYFEDITYKFWKNDNI